MYPTFFVSMADSMASKMRIAWLQLYNNYYPNTRCGFVHFGTCLIWLLGIFDSLALKKSTKFDPRFSSFMGQRMKSLISLMD